MVSESDKAHYDAEGYAIVRNIASRELMSEMARTIARAFRKFNPDAEGVASEPFASPAFHQQLLAFRQERPRDFGLFFDTVQTSVALWRFGTDARLTAAAATFVGDDAAGLSVTDMLVRMDAPNDTRNKLEWHQDSSYFRQNRHGRNGCVCSVALRTLSADEGPLDVLPRSHARGRIDVPKSAGEMAIASEQYRIPEEIAGAYTPVAMMLNAGDAVFMNFDLIHRSGTNVSKIFRLTAIARYHRMFTDDFVAGRLVYNPSKVLG